MLRRRHLLFIHLIQSSPSLFTGHTGSQSRTRKGTSRSTNAYRYNAINVIPITQRQIYFNKASLSTTSLVNLIKIVHLCGVSSSPVVCAVTLCVKNMVESKTASIIPAKNAPQFNCDILGGTEMNFVIIGA